MDFVLQWINPTLVSIIVGIGVSVALVLILLNTYKVLIQEMKRALEWLRKSFFSWRFFFWVVNIICMVFSAQNAGYFFGLYEPIGIALAFVLDLMIITFTQAMLSARAQGDEKRARQVLGFIFLCAFLSTIGNLVHNLQTQNTITTHVDHVWFRDVLPYIGSCIPLLLVLLALVADLVTKANMENIDVAEYEKQEKKRAELLEKRNQYRERQNQAEARFLALLVSQREQKSFYKGALPKSFRWPWEARMDMDTVISSVSAKLAHIYEAKANEIANHKAALSQELSQKQQETERYLETLVARLENQLLQQNTGFQSTLAGQFDEDSSRFYQSLQQRIDAAMAPIEGRVIEMVDRKLQAHNEQITKLVNSREASTHSTGNEESQQPIPSGNEESNEEKKHELSEAEKTALINYPIVASWHSRGVRSVTIEQIISDTGHTPQMVRRREKDGVFKKTRREGYYRTDSVIAWLMTAPLPASSERNKAKKTSGKLEDNQPITDPTIPVVSAENAHVNGNHNDHHNGHSTMEETPFVLPELEVSGVV